MLVQNNSPFRQDSDSNAFLTFIKPALKDPFLIRDDLEVLKLSLSDIADNQKEKFLSNIKQLYIDDFITNGQAQLLKNFNRYGITSLNQMKEEPKKQFFQSLHEAGVKVAKIALKRLHNGHTFFQLLSSIINYHNPISIALYDFHGFSQGELKQAVLQNKGSEMKLSARQSRQLAQRHINSCMAKFKSFEKDHTIMLSICARLSAEGVQVEELTEEKFQELIPQYTQEILQEQLDAKEALAKKVAEELILEESLSQKIQTPARQTKKKTGNQNKSRQTTTTTTSTTAAAQPPKKPKMEKHTESEHTRLNKELMSTKRIFSLHPRICRWNVSSTEEIKKFTDKDRNGNTQKQYAHFSEAELLLQQAYHNLSGIECILSNQKICTKYGVSYPLKSDTNKGIGQCFYAQMNYQRKTQGGLIHVGIREDNVIFHAMFSPLSSEQQLKIRDIFTVIENSDVTAEDSWMQVKPCNVEILADGTLSMKVQKLNVQFILHPLK